MRSFILGQFIQIALTARVWFRGSWWSHPRRVREVKELRHVGLRRVALGQRCKTETSFNHFQDCSRISRCMGDVVLIRVRRNYDQGYTVAGDFEVAKQVSLIA